MSQSVADVIAVLQALPHDAVVRWGDDTVGDDEVLHSGLDIWAPQIARPLTMNSVWTVDLPGDREPDSLADDLHLTLEAEVEDLDGTVGWRAATVSRLLEQWASRHAGRPDLTFEYAPALISDMVRELPTRGRPSRP